MFGNGISLSPLASAFGGEYLLSLWSLLPAVATLFAAKWGGGIKTVKSTKWGKANRVRKRGEEDIYLGCNHVFRFPAQFFFWGGKGRMGIGIRGKNSHFFLPSHVVTAFLSRSVEIESYSSCKPSFLSPNSKNLPWDHPPPSRLVQFFFWPNNIKAKPNNNSTQSSLEGGEGIL